MDLPKSLFKEVTLADQEILLPFYRRLNSRSCDDCFSNLYLWKHLEPMEYQISDGVLILKSKTPKPFSGSRWESWKNFPRRWRQ